MREYQVRRIVHEEFGRSRPVDRDLYELADFLGVPYAHQPAFVARVHTLPVIPFGKFIRDVVELANDMGVDE